MPFVPSSDIDMIMYPCSFLGNRFTCSSNKAYLFLPAPPPPYWKLPWESLYWYGREQFFFCSSLSLQNGDTLMILLAT